LVKIGLLVSGLLLSVAGVVKSVPAQAQSNGWSEPVRLSTTTRWAWFPDVAVDVEGRVHVVYDSGDVPVGQDEAVPGVMYTVYRDGEWSEPNDLLIGSTGNIFRPALAVDAIGYLHMTTVGVKYRHARVNEAISAAAWYQHILDRGVTYMSAVAVDSKGVIHAVYEKWVMLETPIHRVSGGDVVGLADIFYRRSSDGGYTWTIPVNLSRTAEVGSYRVQVKVDANDVVYVSWDEGWDRRSLYGEPQEGVYVFSTDGGQSWSDPVLFPLPERTNAQTTVASDNQGGVLVVWRTTNYDKIFYSWSADQGITWSEPQTIPGIFARSFEDTPFDAYEMETDSAGRIHLVMVGRSRRPESRGDVVPLGVYHLVWDGVEWSEPEAIAIYSPDKGYPEYPRLDISEGNRLHVVWFTRDMQFGGDLYQVWYSSALTDAPYQAPPPTPTATPTPLPTPTFTPTPTATPLPTVPPSGGLPDGLYTEHDELGQLALAALPVLFLILIVAIVRLRWIWEDVLFFWRK